MLTSDPPLASLANRELLSELLADQRSPGTRKAYARDLRNFFQLIAQSDPTPALIEEFLTLNRFEATSLVLKYKGILIEKGLAEATINRRLSAIKALVNYARRIGKCDWSLTDVKGEKVQPYRDTSEVSVAGFKKMAAIPSLDTLKGKRDYALLRLLWENALRRGR